MGRAEDLLKKKQRELTGESRTGKLFQQKGMTIQPVDTRTEINNNEQRKADGANPSAVAVSPMVLPTATQPAVLPRFLPVTDTSAQATYAFEQVRGTTLSPKEEAKRVEMSVGNIEAQIEQAQKDADEAWRKADAYSRMNIPQEQITAAAEEYNAANQKLQNLTARRDMMANDYYALTNEAAIQKQSGNDLFQQAMDVQKELNQWMRIYTKQEMDMTLPQQGAYMQSLREKYGAATDGDVLRYLSSQVKTLGDQLKASGVDYDRLSQYINRKENAQQAAKREAKTKAMAQENPVLASLYSVAAAPAQGIDFLTMLGTGKGSPADMENYVPYDPSTMRISGEVSAIREGVGEKIAGSVENENWGKALQFLYNTGMSIGDSALQVAAFGPGATYLMGMGAAANQSREILERGGTNGQAFWGGLAAGAAEAIFEKFSIENLLSPKTGEKFFKSMLKQAGIEASEEMATEIANILTDAAIMGQRSEFNEGVRAYVQQGMTEQQAKQQAFLDAVGQVALAGLGGALSGGVMGGGVSGFNAIANGARTQTSAQAPQVNAQPQAGVTTPVQQNALTAQETGAQEIVQISPREDATSGQKNNASTGEAENQLLTDADLEKYMQTGVREHVRNQKAEIVKSGQSPLLTTMGQIKAFIRGAMTGEIQNTIKGYGRVGRRMAEDIRAADNNLNVDGYYLELDANRLSHLSDHIQDDGDPRNIPLTEEQVENLTSYIDNYDDVLDVARRKDGSVRLTLGKRINGHAVIIELVSKGRKSIQPVTAWQNTTEHYQRKYGIKKAQPINTSHPTQSETSGYKPAAQEDLNPVNLTDTGTGLPQGLTSQDPSDIMISPEEQIVKPEPMSVKLTQEQKGTAAAVPKALAMIEAGEPVFRIVEETGLHQGPDGTLRDKFGNVVYETDEESVAETEESVSETAESVTTEERLGKRATPSEIIKRYAQENESVVLDAVFAGIKKANESKALAKGDVDYAPAINSVNLMFTIIDAGNVEKNFIKWYRKNYKRTPQKQEIMAAFGEAINHTWRKGYVARSKDGWYTLTDLGVAAAYEKEGHVPEIVLKRRREMLEGKIRYYSNIDWGEEPVTKMENTAEKDTTVTIPKALAMIEAGEPVFRIVEETGLHQGPDSTLRDKFGNVVYVPGESVTETGENVTETGENVIDDAEEDAYAKMERDAIYGRIDEEGNPVEIPAEQTEREIEQAQAATEQTQAMQPSEARKEIDAFLSGESDTVPASELGLTEKPQERKTAGEAVSDAAHFVYRKMVDAGEAVARVGKTVKDSALYAFYNQARASGNAATNMLVDAQTNTKGEYVGEALMDIFQPIIDKGERYYSNFQMFLWHRHNQNRMSLENPQRAQLAELEFRAYKQNHPEMGIFDEERIRELAKYEGTYQETAKGYVRALDELRRARNVKNKPVFGDEYTAEDSKAIADRLLRENPEFAELAKRVYQYEKNLMQYRIDSGLVTQQQADMWAEMYPNYVPTARAKEQAGGKKKGKHAKTSTTVKTAEGGDTQLLPIHVALAAQTRSVVREGSKNRFGQRLLEARDKLGSFATQITESEDNIGEMDLDSRETVLDESQLKNSFTIYKDGKAYTMKVTGDLFEAIDALTPSEREDNALMKALRGSNNLFKVLITGYNPLFTIRNAIKDQQAVMINSKNYAEYVKQYPQAIKEIMTNGRYWQQYKALGGTTSSVLNYQTGKLEAPKGLGKVSARIEAINMGVEQAPRLAEFMATVKAGDGSEANLMQAMLNAQDVTTNFGRGGTWGKWLNSYLVPFLNPSIQGADKFVRSLTERRDFKSWLSLAVKCAIMGFAAPALNGLLYSDDEEWDDLKDRDKNIYFLFKIGDGKWLKIHRGREFSAMSFMSALIKDIATGEQVSVGDYLEEIYNQVGPTNPMDNNLLAAWRGAKLFDPDNPGETWYGGDIESERLQGYAPGDRYDEKTDVVSKWIGGKLNISPKKLNYLIDQYTGVVGDIVLPALSPQAERDMLSSAFTIDSVRSNRYSGEFYDTMDRLEYAKNDPNASGVDKILYRYWNKQNSIVGDVNAAIREIEADETLSQKEKKEQTRDMMAVRNTAQAAALDILDTYRAAAEKAYEAATGSEDERQEIAYREANREVYGAEYAMQTYNKAAYESALEIVEAGVSWDTYYDYYFASRDAKKKSEKRAIVDSMDIGDAERMALFEGVVASESDLESMAQMESSGVEPETAQKIAYTISGIEPEPGKTDVSAQQKYSAIAGMYNLSNEEKLAAILAYDPSEDASTWKKYSDAYDAGLSVREYDEYRVKTSGGKKADKVAAIHAMNITDEQKDFLYLQEKYAQSGLEDTPWHVYKYAGQLPYAGNNFRGQSGGIRSKNSIRGKKGIR